MSESEYLKAAELVLLMQTSKDTHPHPQMNKTGACSSSDAWKPWLSLQKLLEGGALMLLVLGANV
jgi:hypothetical protein